MDKEQKSLIVGALIKKGITQKGLAEKIGVTATSLGYVISGKSRSRRIENEITKITGYQFPPNARVPRYQEEAS